ncbi:MAG TPA: hypothetical protein DDX98_13215 [Bacteroidales bacterium]|jgi:hypothetical protein|nr:hypothetical protein [Bacteroidales bacterium]
MSEEWTAVYSTNLLYHAELVKHLLNDNQIAAVIMNQQDSFYKIGSIDVMVKPADVVRAKHLISKTEF